MAKRRVLCLAARGFPQIHSYIDVPTCAGRYGCAVTRTLFERTAIDPAEGRVLSRNRTGCSRASKFECPRSGEAIENFAKDIHEYTGHQSPFIEHSEKSGDLFRLLALDNSRNCPRTTRMETTCAPPQRVRSIRQGGVVCA